MKIQSLVLSAIAGVVALSLPLSTVADTSGKRIALSNNYAGNSWRQAMLSGWESNGKQAVDDGIIGAADTFTTSENQATEQASQIQNLILQGYDAIVINAASPTAINGAVKQACDAGIHVISFDGVVTEPCAWRIAVDFKLMGANQVKFLAELYPDGGNLLEVRGLAGVFVDDEIHAGIVEEVKNTSFTIAGSIHGDWAQDVAQKAVAGVLPTLPDIVGVVTQGGDGYGAAQAIAATDREMPTIIMGNRQDELQWWSEQLNENGYQTVSASIAPGVSTLAFWVAQQILDGQEVPKDLLVPFMTVTEENLEDVLASTPEGSVADQVYSLEDAKKVIAEAQGD